MTRHSKNNTDGPVFTYHERGQMAHGSKRMRLPGTAIKAWDHCSIGLSPASDPVITPEGVVYDREAILLNFLHQKAEARKRIAKEKGEKAEELLLLARKQKEMKSEADKNFIEAQETAHASGKVVVAAESENSAMSSFWLPNSDAREASNQAPPAKRRKREKVSLRTVCPVTEKPLRARDLISLTPTANVVSKGSTGNRPGAESHHDVQTRAKHMCPVCQAALVNSAKPIALRTGNVLCARCVDLFVMKSSKDPISNEDVDLAKDIIVVHNTGTAFAASAPNNLSSKEATVYRPSVT